MPRIIFLAEWQKSIGGEIGGAGERVRVGSPSAIARKLPGLMNAFKHSP